jgi:hypothetical protein
VQGRRGLRRRLPQPPAAHRYPSCAVCNTHSSIHPSITQPYTVIAATTASTACCAYVPFLRCSHHISLRYYSPFAHATVHLAVLLQSTNSFICFVTIGPPIRLYRNVNNTLQRYDSNRVLRDERQRQKQQERQGVAVPLL